MAKQSNKIPVLTYEPAADVLSYELNRLPIDYAEEIGNIVVHFTKKNVPVLIEILEAKNFLRKSASMMKQQRVKMFA